jgi:quercetin dioxygenase-like cupin family protein
MQTDEKRQLLVGPKEGRVAPGVIFKVYAKDTGGPFSVVEHPLAARVLIPPHIHLTTDQVSYVLEGTLGVRVGNEEFVAEQGSYVVKPRGVPHTNWNPTDEPARLMEISAPGSFEGFFEGLASIFANPGPDTAQRLQQHGARYETTFLTEWIPDLVARHNVKVMGS